MSKFPKPYMLVAVFEDGSKANDGTFDTLEKAEDMKYARKEDMIRRKAATPNCGLQNLTWEVWRAEWTKVEQ